MSTNLIFLAFVVLLGMGVALSVWKGRDRSRYVIAAILIVAGVLAGLVRADQGRRASSIEKERDEVKARLAVRDAQVRSACRRAVSQLHNMELQIQSPIGDELDMTASLLFFGQPLFSMCGAEVDRIGETGGTDAQKIARLRAVREVLQHWETD